MDISKIKRAATCIAALPFLPFWYLQKLLKRDPNLWLFGSTNSNTDSDNCYTLFQYVNKNYKEVRTVWVTRQKSVYDRMKSEGYDNIEMSNTFRGKMACLQAGVELISVGPAETNKRYINGIRQFLFWHSMLLKIIGKDNEAFLQKNSGKKERFLHAFEHFSMPYLFNLKPERTFISSDFFNPMFASAFEIKPESILPIGQPRNDVFFSETTEDIINQINTKYNNPTKIIYMPTFRDNLRNEGKQFNPFNDYGFNPKAFTELLENNNIVFLYKCHNHDGMTDIENFSDRFILLTPEKYQDTYTVLKDVDILMTDYSGVYFDFLLTKKPIILAPFDIEEYQRMRPFYYDYYENIEGCVVHDWNEFIDAVKEHKYFFPSEKTCNKYNKFQDGNNCERILEYLKAYLQSDKSAN